MTAKPKKLVPLTVVAVALACAVPGAGHVYLGRWTRGLIIFVTIGALFWSGVAVGGVFTVDSKHERWWFVAEMFTGVHGLIGWQREKKAYAALANVYGRSEEERMTHAGVALVAPAETVARAYAGVAGLLNLMCIFDALMLSMLGITGEKTERDEHGEPTDKAPPATRPRAAKRSRET